MSEPSEASQPGDQKKDHVQAIYDALGGQPVLLPIKEGEKGPMFDAWERICWADTQTAEFEIKFSRRKKDSSGDYVRGPKGEEIREVYRTARYSEELPKGNIGVALGARSKLVVAGETYHLCSVDIDEDTSLEPFLTLNERLRGTLITKGRRGGNLWLWVLAGSYPPFAKLCHGQADGSPDRARPWGEWRSDGVDSEGKPKAFQTVIFGVHPDGMRYRRVSEAAKPLLIDFADIVWPDSLSLPWRKTPYEQLVETHGEPWYQSSKGALTLNSPFWVGKYASERRVLFEPEEGRFYEYNWDRGLWAVDSEDSIRWKFCGDFKKVADDSGEAQLETKRTNAFLQGLVNLLKGCSEKREAFRREAGVVHLANGMLDLRKDPPTLDPFKPDYFSRNQIPVELNEEAKCPRFLDELLGKGIGKKDDILLLQKWSGQLLLGVNMTQKIMVLTGTAGGGKSTLMNVLRSIIGETNVVGLRTEHLHQRFELWNYVGKTFLVGADVPGNFLMTEGAHNLKALVGKDILTAEKKNGDSVTIIGDFNVGLTSNSRLRVKLDGDTDAWRRRLMIINYELPKPAHPNPRFVEELIASEGSGILNWMIEGAILLLGDIKEKGGLRMTDGQRDRVDSLLAESDSIREYVRKGLAPADGVDHTTAELVTGYIHYCEAKGWNARPSRKVEGQLPDAIQEIHRLTRRNDIQRDGKAARGYRGLRMLPQGDRDEEVETSVASGSDEGGAFGE